MTQNFYTVLSIERDLKNLDEEINQNVEREKELNWRAHRPLADRRGAVRPKYDQHLACPGGATARPAQRGARGVRAALLEACPIRLRPILMTSFATIAAALPLALDLGPGAELRAPMAIAVIGGVFVSTLLTLFVVPCVYELLSGFEGSHAAEATREKEIAQATMPMA